MEQGASSQQNRIGQQFTKKKKMLMFFLEERFITSPFKTFSNFSFLIPQVSNKVIDLVISSRISHCVFHRKIPRTNNQRLGISKNSA